jgi:hypothetical protein
LLALQEHQSYLGLQSMAMQAAQVTIVTVVVVAEAVVAQAHLE